MTNQTTWNFYVGYETEDDGHYEYFDTIFEALANYYLAINAGANKAGVDKLIEIEVGKVVFTGENEEIEPLDSYMF